MLHSVHKVESRRLQQINLPAQTADSKPTVLSNMSTTEFGQQQLLCEHYSLSAKSCRQVLLPSEERHVHPPPPNKFPTQDHDGYFLYKLYAISI